MNQNLNFPEMGQEIKKITEDLFNELMAFGSLRNDEQKRTGMRVYVGEPASRNFTTIEVFTPSEASKKFVMEKPIRSEILGHFSSGNSRDIKLMRFHGSITIEYNGMVIQVSTSGLKEEEDTAVSIRVMSCITKMSVAKVINFLQGVGAVIPEEIYNDKHYLYTFVHAAA